ncbi:uncharacterized protein LOC124117659 [Haliotis rufescens]|uniref:uncharacterized protein LOC124117659 n=1 Tax=Haliotis rufescens TaxID=6454 RepID=UPI00201FAA74|nr:uncharacterized protein LOC124117659 [Haliotis rufescens]
MSINPNKSKIVHFRSQAVTRTDSLFQCSGISLEIVESYCYLGLLLTEHLDYTRMGNAVASAASRALGLLISKSKILGGMEYKTFTKLYDSMVWATIDYGAAIWGAHHIPAISTVHNRAMKYFMGVRKSTPNSAVSGDMGWEPPVVRLWRSVARQRPVYWHCHVTPLDSQGCVQPCEDRHYCSVGVEAERDRFPWQYLDTDDHTEVRDCTCIGLSDPYAECITGFCGRMSGLNASQATNI